MPRSVTGMTVAGLVLAAILFVSFNALSERYLAGARADLTADGLYSVSDGTRAVLAKIDEPVTLKFFYSSRLGQVVPAYGVYADRVRELLREYAALAHGKIDLQMLDPEPFSAVEDQATAAGLQGVPVEEGGDNVYFGLLGVNSTDDTATIPFFQQDRERFLEYDITKLVQELAHPKKKVIGLVTSMTLDGDPIARMQGQPSEPQAVIQQLRENFEVRDLTQNFDKVPDDVSVLMIAQPLQVSPQTEYVIDQWVLKGGRALVFVDPHSEYLEVHPSMMAPREMNAANFDPLLKAWGVELTKGKVVGDRLAARKVNAGGPGSATPADYLAWLNLQGDDLNPADPVTGKLAQINLATAGALTPIKGARTRFTPLLESSDQSELIDVGKVTGMPDVLGLLRDFKPTGQRYVMAARITGLAATAFPDGKPAVDAKPDDQKPADQKPDDQKPAAAKPEAAAPTPKTVPDPNQIKVARQPIDVVVVADSDILDNRFWIETQDFFGRQAGVPNANNGDFVQNAVDSLMGTGDLIGLRSRGSAVRPFVLVDQMQRAAEDRYQRQEQGLQDKLHQTEAKLAGVKGTEDSSGKVQLTPAQQQAIDQFRTQIIQTRTELRQVQAALRRDIDRLKEELVALDVGLVPIGVALVAIILGIVRVQRRKRGVHTV